MNSILKLHLMIMFHYVLTSLCRVPFYEPHRYSSCLTFWQSTYYAFWTFFNVLTCAFLLKLAQPSTRLFFVYLKIFPETLVFQEMSINILHVVDCSSTQFQNWNKKNKNLLCPKHITIFPLDKKRVST